MCCSILIKSKKNKLLIHRKCIVNISFLIFKLTQKVIVKPYFFLSPFCFLSVIELHSHITAYSVLYEKHIFDIETFSMIGNWNWKLTISCRTKCTSILLELKLISEALQLSSSFNWLVPGTTNDVFRLHWLVTFTEFYYYCNLELHHVLS